MNNTISYTLTDTGSLDNDHWAIRIDNGKFTNVLFQFDTVGIEEVLDESSGEAQAKVSFTYTVLDDEFGMTEEAEEEFKQEMSMILQAIMEESSEEKNGSDGNHNTEESSTQRFVHEESLPVSEE